MHRYVASISLIRQRNILETEKGNKNYGEWTPQRTLTLPPVLVLLACVWLAELAPQLELLPEFIEPLALLSPSNRRRTGARTKLDCRFYLYKHMIVDCYVSAAL